MKMLRKNIFKLGLKQNTESKYSRLADSSEDHLLNPPAQSQLQQIAQGHVQSCFEYPQGWKFHNLSGQPAPLFDQSNNKNIYFLILK